MTDILKDIESVAQAGLDMRTRLIIGLGACIVLIVLALGLAHHFEDRGRQLERAGWLKKEADERTADLALIQQHQAEMNELEKHHLLIERETSENHEKELAQLRHDRDADRAAVDRAGGLRIPAPACPADRPVGGTEAPGAGGRDEAGAGTVRLPYQVENDLWSIVNDADEVSGQLRACQSWIRANGFYGPAMSEKPALLDRMIAVPNQQTKDQENDG